MFRVMLSGVKSWYCEFTRRRRVFPGPADVLGLSETRVSARASLADGYRGIDPIEARKPNVPMPTLGAFLEGDCAQYAKANERAYAKNLNRL